MYCVIQKVMNKKTNEYGAHKEILSDSYSFTIDGITKTKYTYKHSDDRFERPILDAYKISIHESYRENGVVKKKQWVICTMGYYSILEYWAGDCIVGETLRKKTKEMGISEEELWEMVYEKFDPIVERIKKEFESTEEYRVKMKHDDILKNHREALSKFEGKYGSNTYDFCYDVFGVLRNEAFLQQLKKQYQEQQEYIKSSYRKNNQSNHNNSSYSDSSRGNYNSNSYSSYFTKQLSNYTDDEKVMLKKIHRNLAKTFHPDITQDNGEIMKLINKLKDGWGI